MSTVISEKVPEFPCIRHFCPFHKGQISAKDRSTDCLKRVQEQRSALQMSAVSEEWAGPTVVQPWRSQQETGSPILLPITYSFDLRRAEFIESIVEDGR